MVLSWLTQPKVVIPRRRLLEQLANLEEAIVEAYSEGGTPADRREVPGLIQETKHLRLVLWLQPFPFIICLQADAKDRGWYLEI